MGLFKFALGVILLVYAVMLLNSVMVKPVSVIQECDNQTDDRLSKFIMKEHNLCVGGLVEYKDNVLICSKTNSEIYYNCTKACKKSVRVLE